MSMSLDALRDRARSRAGLRVLAWVTAAQASSTVAYDTARQVLTADDYETLGPVLTAWAVSSLVFNAMFLAGLVAFARGQLPATARSLAWGAVASWTLSLVLGVAFFFLPASSFLEIEAFLALQEVRSWIGFVNTPLGVVCVWGAIFVSDRHAPRRVASWLPIAVGVSTVAWLAWTYFVGPALASGKPLPTLPFAPTVILECGSAVAWIVWYVGHARALRVDEERDAVVVAWGMRAFRGAVLWRIALMVGAALCGGMVSYVGDPDYGIGAAALLASMTAALLVPGIAAMWEGARRGGWGLALFFVVALLGPILDGFSISATVTLRFSETFDSFRWAGVVAQALGTIAFWSLLYALRCAAAGVQADDAVATIDRIYAATFAGGIVLVLGGVLAASAPGFLLVIAVGALALGVWVLVAFVGVLRRIAGALEATVFEES